MTLESSLVAGEGIGHFSLPVKGEEKRGGAAGIPLKKLFALSRLRLARLGQSFLLGAPKSSLQKFFGKLNCFGWKNSCGVLPREKRVGRRARGGRPQ